MTDEDMRRKQRLVKASHDILVALGPLSPIERMRLLATFAIEAGQYKAAQVALVCIIEEEAATESESETR